MKHNPAKARIIFFTFFRYYKSSIIFEQEKLILIIKFVSPEAIGVWSLSSGERPKEKIQAILLILSK
jgi:hypothetical protein